MAENLGWAQFSQISGTGDASVSVSTAAEYQGRGERSQIIKGTAGSGVNVATDQYTLYQDAGNEFLKATNLVYQVNAAAGTLEVTGRSNAAQLAFTLPFDSFLSLPTNYTVTPDSGSAITVPIGSAITGDPGLKGPFTWKIALPYTANGTIIQRQNTLTVAVVGNTGLLVRIAINQLAGAATLTISPSEMTFAATSAGAQNLQISSNASYRIVASDSSWIQVSANSGTGNQTITVNAGVYNGRVNRTGTVTVTTTTGGASVVRTLTITQTAKAEYVTFGSPSYSIGKAGGTLNLIAVSNAKGLNFTVVSGGSLPVTIPNTFSVKGLTTGTTIASVANNGYLSTDLGASEAFEATVPLSIGANYTISERTVQIKVTTKDGGVVATVTITQTAGDVSFLFTPKSGRLTYSGTPVVTVSISCNTTWSLSVVS
jgi:hypothetical protein